MAKNVFGGLGIGAQNTKKTQPKAEQMQGGLAAILEDLQQKTTDLQQTLNQAQGASSNQGQSSAVKQQTAQIGHGAGSAQQNANIQSNANGQQAGADEHIQSVLGKIAGYGKGQQSATNSAEAQPKSIVQLLAEMQQKDKEAQDKSAPSLESTLTMGLQDWANENEGVTTDKDNKLFLDGFLENKSELINGHGAKTNLLNDQSLSDIFVTATPEEAGAEEGDKEKPDKENSGRKSIFEKVEDIAGYILGGLIETKTGLTKDQQQELIEKAKGIPDAIGKFPVEELTWSETDGVTAGYDNWNPPPDVSVGVDIVVNGDIRYVNADGEYVYRSVEPTVMEDGIDAYKIILPDGGVIYENTNGNMLGKTGTERRSEQILPIYNDHDNRSEEAYTAVLKSMNVAEKGEKGKSRYTGGRTYCNFYVWDVTSAMGCEIPYYLKEKDGEYIAYDFKDKNGKSFTEEEIAIFMDRTGDYSDAEYWAAYNKIADSDNSGIEWATATKMIRWLGGEGQSEEYGWNRVPYAPPERDENAQNTDEYIVSEEEDALIQELISIANEGKPVVVGWDSQNKGDSHVAMIAPQEYVPGMAIKDIKIYQAGIENVEDYPLGFADKSPFKSQEKIDELQFFYND